MRLWVSKCAFGFDVDVSKKRDRKGLNGLSVHPPGWIFLECVAEFMVINEADGFIRTRKRPIGLEVTSLSCALHLVFPARLSPP